MCKSSLYSVFKGGQISCVNLVYILSLQESKYISLYSVIK